MKTKFKGTEIDLAGNFIKKGDTAPTFCLAKTDMTNLTLTDLKNHKCIINIFPSLDTSVCAMSVRRFNQEASKLPNVKVLCVSKDLPFAQSRFCVAEGIENVIMLSDCRYKSNFGNDYGVQIKSGMLSGLLARAIVVIDENSKVIYSSINNEITEEPDYNSALASVKSC
ncbi:MAG: thiol peroxidase [Verrucomicrobiaceae bacterium]|nr:thiol peroxidase [Verrucomicrobiaceae bacterium]